MKRNEQSLGRLIGWAFGILAVLAVLGWAFGWFATPLQVTSAENVRKQFAFAYQFEESLDAAAKQYCSAREARDRAEGDVRNQRESQIIAIEQNYARIAAEYNAKLRNAFEAKYVAPSDVPRQAASLEVKVAMTCKKP